MDPWWRLYGWWWQPESLWHFLPCLFPHGMDGCNTQFDAVFYHFLSTQLPSLEKPLLPGLWWINTYPWYYLPFLFCQHARGNTQQRARGRFCSSHTHFEIPAKFPSGHCSNNYACMQLMFPDCLWSSVPVPSLCSPVEITRAGWNTQAGQNSTPWKISQPLFLEEIFQPTQNKKKRKKCTTLNANLHIYFQSPLPPNNI